MRKLFLTFISLCLMASAWAVSPTTLTVSSTAGGLSSAIKTAGGSLTTVSTLTITGTIDARDFKMMRDSMSALTNINLSGASIAAYTGTDGTAGTTSTTYLSNVVPQYAFCNTSYVAKTSLTSINIPTTVTSFGAYSFSFCNNLSSINIPTSVTSIGEGAFFHYNGSTSLTIPSSVISIGANAFNSASSLITVDAANPNYSSQNGVLFDKAKTTLIYCPSTTSGTYTIPSSVNTIGLEAFSYCSSITSLVIPNSVTTITGDFAFASLSGLTSLVVYSSVPLNLSSKPNTFNNVNKTTCILHVPTGSKTAYQTAYGWGSFSNIVADVISGIEESKCLNLKINNTNGKVQISGLTLGVRVTIYNLQGIAIYNQKATEETISINLPARGVYVVKVGTQSLKIID